MLRQRRHYYCMKYLDKDLFIDLLYEDNHLLVVDKPFHLLTQPSGTRQEHLEGRAKKYLQKTHQKENIYLHAVHRLDKEVGGIVVFAKTSKALSRMQEQIRNRAVKKIYFAQVEGKLPQKSGTLKHLLQHGSHRAKISSQGKESTLKYTVFEESKNTSYIEIELITGRYHQIRIQLSEIGCPVLGDQKYGSRIKQNHLALIHKKFICTHPTLKEQICFQSLLELDASQK